MARALVLVALALTVVPACSSTPQCVIDTDCPLGQYCTNAPGGSGGTCVAVGGGTDSGGGGNDAFVARDTGPAGDSGLMGDTGPRRDTGPATDTGPMPDVGPHDAGGNG